MDSDGLWKLIILVILLGCSAFFSAAETALTKLSKIRIRQLIGEGVKEARTINKIVENPNKLMNSIIIVDNAANIGATALATSIAVSYFKENGTLIAIVIMIFLILIIGEITPRLIAAKNSEYISLKVVKPISFVTNILSPVAAVFTFIADMIAKLFGIKENRAKPYITEEELKTIVDVSHEEGLLEGEEKQMIYNVFEFGDSQVKDVMVQRTDIVAIKADSTYDEIIDVFKKEHYSRMPIYKDNTDNIVGILHIKSLIFYDGPKEKFDLSKYMLQPYFTYEYKSTAELFDEMRKNKIAMAIVLDEYGGTAGIVTMEDLVEEIVGEIEDEYDESDEEKIEVIKEDEYIVDGSTKIDLVNEMIGTNIESEDFDSIGGYVIGVIGGFPKNGQTIECGDIEFIIEDIDKNRIKKLKIITN